jgi:hypothetical protein
VQVLQTVSIPLDDVAILAAPATGPVAVVDATARAILDALRKGDDEREVAAALARSTGAPADEVAGHVAALRRSWVELALPRRRATLAASAPRQAWAHGAGRPALDVVCRFGTTHVRLRVWPPRLARMLAAITAPSHAHGGEAAGPVLEAHRRGRNCVLLQDGARLLTTDDLMVARSEALRQLVLASYPGREWLAVLHGAGVAGPCGAALLCGTSGAGKSTLTGFLLAAGLQLVTDDYAPLEAGSWKLWPVPFGLSVKEGSWPLLVPHFPDLIDAPVVSTRERRQRYLHPPRLAAAPQPVRCLVFPLYRPGAAVDLLKLRPGEALELCARSGG